MKFQVYSLEEDFTEIVTEDFIIGHYEDEKEDKIIVKFKVKEHSCPVCNGVNMRIKDYRNQNINYLSPLGKKGILTIRKRRYKCKCCGKYFKEDSPYMDTLLECVLREVYINI